MVSRYGVKIRKREKEVLKKTRAKYECPTCGKTAVKRSGTALWKCKSCGAVIAGGAFSLETQVGGTAAKMIESIKQAKK